jgi:hypothetical protein
MVVATWMNFGAALAEGTVDSNVFYYSYSTIAQAVAGAFGFLAAVVLFRLQALNGQLEVIATNLMGDPRTFQVEPFRTLFVNQKWPEFVDNVRRDQDPSNRNPVFKGLNFMDLGAMEHAKQQVVTIRRWFMISMIITMASISLCMVSLVFMAWFQSMALLGFMLTLGLACLATYMRLMYTVLQING